MTMQWLAIARSNRVHQFDMSRQLIDRPWVKATCGHYAARHRLHERNETQCKKCLMEIERKRSAMNLQTIRLPDNV